MEFKLYSAHEGNLNESVIINSIKELRVLSKRFDAEVIINFEENCIWIYDDYME